MTTYIEDDMTLNELILDFLKKTDIHKYSTTTFEIYCTTNVLNSLYSSINIMTDITIDYAGKDTNILGKELLTHYVQTLQEYVMLKGSIDAKDSMLILLDKVMSYLKDPTTTRTPDFIEISLLTYFVGLVLDVYIRSE